MDHALGFVGRHDDDFEESARTICSDDQPTQFAVIFLFDVSQGMTNCMQDVRIIHSMLARTLIDHHVRLPDAIFVIITLTDTYCQHYDDGCAQSLGLSGVTLSHLRMVSYRTLWF